MQSGPDAFRIVQMHVSRRCNLSCLHCYSQSGPRERQELAAALLLDALDDAAALGYNCLGVSGGEPILYRPLPELLAHARSLGMATTVTTNGMLLDQRRITVLRGLIDVLAISLDGEPHSHNRMRGHPRAFQRMAANLPALRESGIGFGFIFTLTQHNMNELLWVADFACAEGARLLQIHPLEAVGRARDMLVGAVPDARELAVATLVVARLQEIVGDALTVQLDVTSKESIAADPARVFAGGAAAAASLRFADIVEPLIIEPDGMVVPIEYSFGQQLALGNLQTARLADLATAWRRDRWPAFRDVCHRVHARVTSDDAPLFVNWYETVSREAGASAVQ